MDLSVMYKIDRSISERTLMVLALLHGDYTCLDDNMSCYRRSNKKTSVTSQIYQKGVSALSRDYRITLALEKLALDTYHVQVNFSTFKKILFVKACALGIIKCRSEFGKIGYRIWKDSQFDISYFLFTPFYLMHKGISAVMSRIW